MKLTDQIKEKIERADSKEKKQDILNDIKNKVMDAGVILDDSELEQVPGGEHLTGKNHNFGPFFQ